MHSATERQTDRQTDGQTDGQQDYANSRSYCVAVRSAKKEVRRVIGLFSYFREYIPNFVPHAHCLTELRAFFQVFGSGIDLIALFILLLLLLLLWLGRSLHKSTKLREPRRF